MNTYQLRCYGNYDKGPFCCFTGNSIRSGGSSLALFIWGVISCVFLVLISWQTVDWLYAIKEIKLPQQWAITTMASFLILTFIAFSLSTKLRFLVMILLFSMSLSFWGYRNSLPYELTIFPEFPDEIINLIKIELEPLHLLQFHLVQIIINGLGILSFFYNILRNIHLPQKIFFARYHPLWGNYYSPNGKNSKAIGIAFIQNDPVLKDKLVWLHLQRNTNTIVFSGISSTKNSKAIPVAHLAQDLILHYDGEWTLYGEYSKQNYVKIHLFCDNFVVKPHSELPVQKKLAFAETQNFQVQDIFERHNQFYSKSHKEDYKLHGLLLDSRKSDKYQYRMTPIFSNKNKTFYEYASSELQQVNLSKDSIVIQWQDHASKLKMQRQDSIYKIVTKKDLYFLYFVSTVDGEENA